jgi:hypothetical protein
MESNNPRPWFTDMARATILLATGDTARALEAMERCANSFGPVCAEYLPLDDAAWDPVRRSPRFAGLVRNAKVDESVITAPRRSPTR